MYFLLKVVIFQPTMWSFTRGHIFQDSPSHGFFGFRSSIFCSFPSVKRGQWMARLTRMNRQNRVLVADPQEYLGVSKWGFCLGLALLPEGRKKKVFKFQGVIPFLLKIFKHPWNLNKKRVCKDLCLFSPRSLQMMIQFDDWCNSNGLVQPPTFRNQSWPCHKPKLQAKKHQKNYGLNNFTLLPVTGRV